MPTEELLTHWTIRLALVCYVAVLAGQLAVRREHPGWQKAARWLWTAGWAFFIAHVVCAFQFYHHWSHARVLEDTARQTKEMMGWAFGEGIYVSYLFTLLWTADVLWWWVSPAGYLGRPRGLNIAVHAFMLFIAFNGAMVFEGGVTRWFGAAACVGLALLLGWRILSNRQRPVIDNN